MGSHSTYDDENMTRIHSKRLQMASNLALPQHGNVAPRYGSQHGCQKYALGMR